MITVKFIGGAKKIFQTDETSISESNISINDLLQILSKIKPPNTENLDLDNTLIAINGADSASLDGLFTNLKDGDLVSLIPIIHGGSEKSLSFTFLSKNVEIYQIKGDKIIDVKFLEELRNSFPKITIQSVSSRFILNSSHLKKIIKLSIISQKNDVLLSNKIETDILMRFALMTQISSAINTVGIRPKEDFILICIGNKKQLSQLKKQLTVQIIPMFETSNESFLKKHFKISKNELESVYSKNSLEDILLERASILFS